MRANEFIKKAGLNEVKRLLSTATVDNDNKFGVIPCNYWIGDPIDINELKRLIESHEVVQKMSGLDECKRKMVILVSMGDDRARILEKAIADVESCL